MPEEARNNMAYQSLANRMNSLIGGVGKTIGGMAKNLTSKKVVKTTNPMGLSPASNIGKYKNEQQSQLDEINRLTK